VAAVGKLYSNNKETAVYKRRNNTQNNAVIQNTLNRKETNTIRTQTYKEY